MNLRAGLLPTCDLFRHSNIERTRYFVECKLGTHPFHITFYKAEVGKNVMTSL
jgi:hypothetical protein